MQQDKRAVLVPLKEITLWKQNPNKHSPRQIDAIRASIRKFGFVNSITIAKILHEGGVMELRAGEGRVLALTAELRENPAFVPPNLNAKPGMVPAIIHEFATRADADAYGIVDETIADMSEFDDMLAADLLREMGIDDGEVENLGLGDLLDLDLEDIAPDDWGNKGEREPSRLPVIEMALRVPDEVTEVERALALAVKRNPMLTRGQALVEVCKSYMGGGSGQA